jgi:hypothetical protein
MSRMVMERREEHPGLVVPSVESDGELSLRRQGCMENTVHHDHIVA